MKSGHLRKLLSRGLQRPLSPAASLISARPFAPLSAAVLRPALRHPQNFTISASGPTNIFGARQAWIQAGVWTLPSCVTLGKGRCLSDLLLTQYDTIFEYSLTAGRTPSAHGSAHGECSGGRNCLVHFYHLPSPPSIHPSFTHTCHPSALGLLPLNSI